MGMITSTDYFFCGADCAYSLDLAVYHLIIDLTFFFLIKGAKIEMEEAEKI